MSGPALERPRNSGPDDERILREVADIAREKLGFGGEVDARMRLVEDLGLDSLRLLTLAVAVEDRFQVSLDEDDEASIQTVADLVRVVRSKLPS